MVKKADVSKGDKKPWLKRENFPVGKRFTGKIVRSQLVTFPANQWHSEPEDKLVIEFEGFEYAWRPNNMSLNLLIDRFGEKEADWRGKLITICRPCDWPDELLDGGTAAALPDAIYVSHITDKPENPMQNPASEAGIASGWSE